MNFQLTVFFRLKGCIAKVLKTFADAKPYYKIKISRVKATILGNNIVYYSLLTNSFSIIIICKTIKTSNLSINRARVKQPSGPKKVPGLSRNRPQVMISSTQRFYLFNLENGCESAIIQMKSSEQLYFPVLLFVMLHIIMFHFVPEQTKKEWTYFPQQHLLVLG